MEKKRKKNPDYLGKLKFISWVTKEIERAPIRKPREFISALGRSNTFRELTHEEEWHLNYKKIDAHALYERLAQAYLAKDFESAIEIAIALGGRLEKLHELKTGMLSAAKAATVRSIRAANNKGTADEVAARREECQKAVDEVMAERGWSKAKTCRYLTSEEGVRARPLPGNPELSFLMRITRAKKKRP